MTAPLTLRDQIMALGLNGRRPAAAGWPPGTFIGPMTAAERDELERLVLAEQKRGGGQPPNFRAQVLARALCTEAGARLFTTSAEDVAALGTLDARLVDEAAAVALELSGLAAGAAEDARKN